MRTIGLFLLALLKIFGWVLLALLLLLIVGLLLVLFVPVRYQVFVSNGRSTEPGQSPMANLRLRVKVTWLLHLVRVSIRFGEDGLQTNIRAAGVDVKKVLAWFGRRSEKKAGAESGSEADAAAGAMQKAPVQNQEQDMPAANSGSMIAYDADKPKTYKSEEPAEETEPEPTEDFKQSKAAGKSEKKQKKKNKQKQKQKQKKKQKKKKESNKVRKQQHKQKRKRKAGKKQKKRKSKTATGAGSMAASGNRQQPKQSIVARLRSLYRRLHREFTDQANRHAVSSLFAEVLRLLRSYRPRKLRAEVSFSLANPAWTGGAVGMISLMPWVYRYPCTIVPDFTAEKPYAEGEIEADGKVAVYVFLWSLLRLVRDKQFMQVVRRLLKRNGAS